VLADDAALGVMQAGMVHALYERGIVPDLLIGTSAGALNAAFLASRPQTESVDMRKCQLRMSISKWNAPRWLRWSMTFSISRCQMSQRPARLDRRGRHQALPTESATSPLPTAVCPP